MDKYGNLQAIKRDIKLNFDFVSILKHTDFVHPSETSGQSN